MPPAKSMYSLPSASQRRAPQARATTRSVVATPRGTNRSRAANTRSAEARSSTRIAREYLVTTDEMQSKSAELLRNAQRGRSVRSDLAPSSPQSQSRLVSARTSTFPIPRQSDYGPEACAVGQRQ